MYLSFYLIFILDFIFYTAHVFVSLSNFPLGSVRFSDSDSDSFVRGPSATVATGLQTHSKRRKRFWNQIHNIAAWEKRVTFHNIRGEKVFRTEVHINRFLSKNFWSDSLGPFMIKHGSPEGLELSPLEEKNIFQNVYFENFPVLLTKTDNKMKVMQQVQIPYAWQFYEIKLICSFNLPKILLWRLNREKEQSYFNLRSGTNVNGLLCLSTATYLHCDLVVDFAQESGFTKQGWSFLESGNKERKRKSHLWRNSAAQSSLRFQTAARFPQ